LEDWNAVEKQRAIDEYLAKNRVYCKDCDNYAKGHCYLLFIDVEETFTCQYCTKKVEHVGRSNDTVNISGDSNHSGSLDNQPVICSYPCMDSTCKHHPIAAPIDGTTCRYIDLHKSEGCVRKDD